MHHTADPAEAGGVLLVVGSGAAAFREYAFQEIAASGQHRLWLMTDTPPTWERPYLAGWTLTDPLTPDVLTKDAAEVAESRRITGVLCLNEAMVWPAAHVAEELGLPGPARDAVWRCRDKALTRAALAAHGVAEPGAETAADLGQALDIAAAIGYPVVCKPRALGGSIGVRRADGPHELTAAFTAATAELPDVPQRFAASVLVEPYLDGPEISVDALVTEDGVMPLVIARKQTSFPPFFEESGHVIDGADPLYEDPALARELLRVHRALGITGCVTHSEWRLTSDGPRLVEVNARPGGDLIPFLGAQVTGVSAVLVAADLATGRNPAPVRRPNGAAAIEFLYPDTDLTLVGLSVQGVLPDGVHVHLSARPGDVLALPPRGYKARYGWISARGESVAHCRELIARARATIRVEAAA
ncbi:ATP-grasp domain-containing protein [Streptomyces sp. NPDC126499]|uniref:ATP-grasp domain-containing protein n=1 Tax=Streptomyces sp. NPDC126499 TaxID=3155314 RepID=UPI00332DA252